MAAEILTLDPVSELATNVELVITTGSYGLIEHKYPQPPLTAQWASSVDTEGAAIGSRKHENRQIQITLDVDGLTALRALQAKLTKLHRETGTLKRTMSDGTVIVFDVFAVEGFDPDFGSTFDLAGVSTVSFTLTCAPYGRGPVVTLSDHVETTLPFLIFTEASITGDIPALGRLVVDNDDAVNDQRFAIWAIQSNYDSAATAALFYQAESCAIAGVGPVAAAGAAGASGSGNNVIRHPNVGSGAIYNGLVYIGTSSTAQTHVGTFRVLARVYAPATNTGTCSVRMTYQPYSEGPTVTNDSVALADSAGTPLEGFWIVVDLGQVTIPEAVVGTQGWLGQIQGTSTVAADDLDVDWVALVPGDDFSGQAYSTSTVIAAAGATVTVKTSGSIEWRHDGVYATTSGGRYRRPDAYEGGYLRIPPGTVRVLVKLSRGGTNFVGHTLPLLNDAGIDDLSARLSVTPRYLVVPS